MSYWKSSVSTQVDDTILIRGYPIEQIIGRLSYASALFLTLRGELPTDAERRMLDAALCAIIDYATGPSPVAGRVVVSANPSIGAAMAAGILAQGAYAASPQDAGEMLEQLAGRVAGEAEISAVARAAALEARSTRARLPGMGHPSDMATDPRAERLKLCAQELGFWALRCRILEALSGELAALSGRPLGINVNGMLAAILGDMGFSSHEMGAIAAISMLPGIVANAIEEMHSGARIRLVQDMEYTGPARRDLPKDRG